MSEAPERISVYPLEGTWGYGGMEFAEGDEPGLVEYVRADRIEELEAKLADRDAMVEAAYRMALDDAAASYEVNYLLAKRLGVEIPAYHLDLRAITPPADLVERVGK